jgi:hypothetical protein
MVMVDVVADAAARELERRLNEKDFIYELTGRNAGRMKRFFAHSVGGPLQVDDEEEAESEFLDSVLRTMREEIRLQRIQRLRQDMALAETTSYEALMAARERFDLLKKLIGSMLDNAQQLPDGRRVFLSRDGSYAIDESGERLSQDEMSQVEWRTDGPKAEDYQAVLDGLEAAQQDIDQIEEFREDLASAQERVSSGEPLSAAELDDIGDLLKHMPENPNASTMTRDTSQQQASGHDYEPPLSDSSNSLRNP